MDRGKRLQKSTAARNRRKKVKELKDSLTDRLFKKLKRERKKRNKKKK